MGVLIAYCPGKSHNIVLGKAKLPEDAAAVQQLMTFDIPSGTLESVLLAFQKTSGVQVVIPNDAMRSIGSPGVTGLYSPEHALREILRATGISYRFSDKRTVILELHAGPASVEIKDDATVVLSSTKYTEPLRDTPQTINVISKEVMEEQGATTLRDVLKNVPGLTITAGEGSDTVLQQSGGVRRR